MTSLARDASALLDSDADAPGQGADRSGASQAMAANIAACLQVGRRLLGLAGRTGRYHAAIAAVEVFRIAIEQAGNDPSLHNGLGAALVECGRLESGAEAAASMSQAADAFRRAASFAARQAVSRAAILRYQMNMAMVLWMQGERETDRVRIEKSLGLLRGIAGQLTDSSPHWAHLQDNLGNALMALGRVDRAIAAYQAALAGRQSGVDRGRSLNNLGTAFAEQGRYAEAGRAYREALTLQPRDTVPLAWARTQHNLATTLLREALASEQPSSQGKRLTQAIRAFEAARAERGHLKSSAEWAATTANLASAHVSFAVHQHAGSAGPRAADQIQDAIALYREAMPALAPAALRQTIQNCGAAVQILRRLSDGTAITPATRDHLAALASLAADHGPPELATLFGQDQREPPPARAAEPPRDMDWPSETYSQAHRTRGEDIIAFLSRVWLPLIQAGVVDMRVLRAKDPSAAKGVDNFRQKIDPTTGQRRQLPAQLHLPTKREINDRLAASITDPGDRPARLDWALRSRARRAKSK